MTKPKPFRKRMPLVAERRISIDELYPSLTHDERAEAAFFLGRYLEVVRRIFQRGNNLTDRDKSARV